MRTAPSSERKLLAAQLRDPHLGVEQQLGREVAEGDDDGRVDELDLGFEVRAAAVDLERQRVTVARWPALHDVRDVDGVAVEADALDQAREQSAGPPDERNPVAVLLLARTLADEHQPGIAGRRSRTPPACASRRAGTSCTRARPVRDLRTMRTPMVQATVRARTRETRSTAVARESRTMLRDRRSDRGCRDLGRQEAKPVDVRVDLAGGDRERDVAVVTGVRGMDRPDEPVVSALGEQPALELGAASRWWRRRPTWCWSPPRTGRTSGNAERALRGARAREHGAVRGEHVARPR